MATGSQPEAVKVYINPTMIKKIIDEKRTNVATENDIYEWIKGKMVELELVATIFRDRYPNAINKENNNPALLLVKYKAIMECLKEYDAFMRAQALVYPTLNKRSYFVKKQFNETTKKVMEMEAFFKALVSDTDTTRELKETEYQTLMITPQNRNKDNEEEIVDITDDDDSDTTLGDSIISREKSVTFKKNKNNESFISTQIRRSLHSLRKKEG